ncbi:MAG: polymerase sigma factor, sigma-70 family [Solirubrobacterales bacterium]|jgi:DNA-directed RNA polymerase specialized sigma24 family protein|nr:polymerase sigma factor, sigma-70 family [Solirubrobacterales bacterium]
MDAAFTEIYERHVQAVYAFHVYRVRSHDLAEDLTQLTFERALRAWGRYDPALASVLTWLLAIGRNLLIDHVRADRGSQQVVFDADVHSPAVGAPRLPGLSPALADALAQLPERDQEVLALRFGADLQGAEIADVTGLSLANVQQILSRSLRRLHSQLTTVPPEDLPTRRASQT